MTNKTRHYEKARNGREKLISKIIKDGNPIVEFVVDKGHKNGLERHVITDTGLIIIYNLNSGKLVTKLIARPEQLTRYRWDVPKSILQLAEWHKSLQYNWM